MRIRSSVCVLLAIGSMALGQNQPSPEQLKQMYDNAVLQLQQQTERKNELAQENQKLQSHVAELEKQVSTLETEKQADANRSFFLREHYSAWETFVELNPLTKAMWSEFMTLRGNADEALAVLLWDPQWPFGLEAEKPVSPFGEIHDAPAATEPTTVPTTSPTTEPATVPETQPTTTQPTIAEPPLPGSPGTSEPAASQPAPT